MGLYRNVKKILGFPGRQNDLLPQDFEALHKSIVEKVNAYTMTSPERLFSLIEAVKHIVKHDIEGDIVECGVWKGGSMLAIADTLVASSESKRQLYLYDTFEGMPPPGEEDVNFSGKQAQNILQQNKNKEVNLVWAYSPLETVKKTLSLSYYDKEKIKYVVGKVEDTIPRTIPEKISILRLDTDWYESTKHELIHLYPRLQKGGILIIDDYGYWKGARKAVDEYFSEHQIPIFLSRIDDTGRIAVKF